MTEQDPVFFYTETKNKNGRNIKLAVALEGDRIIYCKGRLRKKFLHSFKNRQDKNRYMSMLYDKAGVNNMTCQLYKGASK